MFRLPRDVENQLIQKYPNVDILNLIHDLITMTIQKACFDGSCFIREFGKFLAYKVFSPRMGKDTVRFKFKHSVSFLNRLRNDKYILDKLAIKLTVPFTEQNEKKCADKQDQKKNIHTILPQIQKVTDQKTDYRVTTQEILKILESPTE